ncbi:MAG TPA: hypothetical protein DIW27_12065 [Cytophagales bacterium]|nr:hypothetical protein [Cytophagales bacterium]
MIILSIGMIRRLLFIVMIALLGYATKGIAQPDTVKAGSYVISVHDINFHEKEYTIRFWLWFLYSNPDFDFATQLDIPNAKVIDPPEIIYDSLNDKAWVIMKMKCTMKQNWDVRDFPFDEQHLKVQIENTLFDKNSLVFKPDVSGSNFDHKEAIDGWSIKNFKITQGDNDYETGFGDHESDYQLFSALKIEMNIEREAWGLFAKIFIGMYIAFLIAIISFTPKPSELEPRFGLPVGGLFAAVGNKYIIDSLLPESSDFTLVDTLHALTYLAIFGCLLVSAIALKYNDDGKVETSLKINSIGAKIVIGVYIIANLFFVVLAIND